ncbi:uncharacterized protein EI90DRAFT_3242195, partial [Cantharellus anzutake]|uniref:uncharacterized protein n=1 Tax=Cantharellus anzutake TaxID=1750568 RepID=UPI0019040C27
IAHGLRSGIGRATAIALSAARWTVVLSGRREAELHLTASRCPWETLVVPTDVSKEEEVMRLFQRTIKVFGMLDLLFNNAGTGGPRLPLDQVSGDEFMDVINVNVFASFLCTREAVKIFKRQGKGGRIINNGSLAAHVPRPNSVSYTVSKHAISGLTKSTALDGRQFNITCTQIDIGNASTEMTAGHSSGALQPDGTTRSEALCDVNHVADTIVHIASLPHETTVLTVNVMATGMPFVGRG